MAPCIGLTEYVADAPLHKEVGPVIEPVAPNGVATVTVAALVPVQPLAAVPVTV